MKQIYLVPLDLVHHLLDDDNNFKDREVVKKIARKCGDVLSLYDYEKQMNNGDIDVNENYILID